MPPLLLLTMPTLDCIYRQHDKKVMHSSHLASASMSYSRPALMTADLAKQQMRIQMASAILLKSEWLQLRFAYQYCSIGQKIH